MKKVAVIGAGCSGLTAIKACKEEGIEVVCFEKSAWIGGLWHYHEDSEDGKPSVMRSTVINTHKELTAFSDFPPPDDFSNYMHHSQLLEYFELYAKHFELYPHIRFQTLVLQVSKANDYEETGQWIVVSKSLQSQVATEEKYDGVMICSGHHAYENFPELSGQALFKGMIVHSHSIKTPDAFKDLKVMVIGIGNSALDAAVETSNVAQQVYLSTRRGAWITPRCGPLGLPIDIITNNRIFRGLFSILSWQKISWLVEYFLVNAIFNHKLCGLQPKHHFLSQHPSTNDQLQSKIMSGRIIVKRNVEKFTPDGVIFEGEDKETPIDAVVFATGYNITFPFISESFANIHGNKVNFYKLTFPPHLKHPSLAFIGLIQPAGSIMPISEAQSRWFALAINRKVQLPSLKIMLGEISKRQEEIDEKFVKSRRHTVQVDYVWFMDDITSEYGSKPNLLKMMFTDPILFTICLLGPCLPYQYRLQGPHSWPRAREAIMKFPKRVTKPLSCGVRRPSFSHFEVVKFCLPNLLLLFSVFFNVCLLILCLF